MVFISEPNLYRLIARSKLPTAQKFERWIFEEVLPSIRKTGAYVMPGAAHNQDALGVSSQEIKERKSAATKGLKALGRALNANANSVTNASTIIREIKAEIKKREVAAATKQTFDGGIDAAVKEIDEAANRRKAQEIILDRYYRRA
jgi:prophage antirepressor-like protein